jgi:hypothetical protein
MGFCIECKQTKELFMGKYCNNKKTTIGMCEDCI